MLNKKETVDVIIPVGPKASQKLLDRAKESVKKQTVFTNTIVINDIEGKGPAWARNRGIEMSENRYIAFLDSDDYWEPDKLEKQIKKMKKEKAGFCVTSTDAGRIKPTTEKEFLESFFKGGVGTSITSTMLVDKEQGKIPRFDETLYRKEDDLFALETCIRLGYCYVPTVLCHIEKTESGLSSNADPDKFAESFKEFYYKALSLYPEGKKFYKHYWKTAYYSAGRYYYYKKKNKKATQYIIKSFRCKPALRPVAALVLALLQINKLSR